MNLKTMQQQNMDRVLVVLLCIAVLVLDNRNNMITKIMMTAEAATVLSFGKGRHDYSAASRPAMNHLQWTYQIVSHHPKALPHYGEVVEDAIAELLTSIVAGDWEYDSSEMPCDSVQLRRSNLRSIVCSSCSGMVESIEDLDPLGLALVDLMTELPKEYGGNFNVTWVMLPQPANTAEYMYDITVLNNSSDSKDIYDAFDLVDFAIFQAVENAGIQVNVNGVVTEECTFWPCDDSDADTDDYDPNADDDNAMEVICYHFDCFLFTVKKGMDRRVRKAVQLAIQEVNQEYDWLNVTFVPLNTSEVGTNNAATAVSFLERATGNIMQH